MDMFKIQVSSSICVRLGSLLLVRARHPALCHHRDQTISSSTSNVENRASDRLILLPCGIVVEPSCFLGSQPELYTLDRSVTRSQLLCFLYPQARLLIVSRQFVRTPCRTRIEVSTFQQFSVLFEVDYSTKRQIVYRIFAESGR